MASDEDLQRLRERRLLEMQSQQRQADELSQARQEAEARKDALLRKVLSPEARQRLANIKMVRPEYVGQLEIQLIQIAQSGRVSLPISDEVLRRLLAQVQNQQRRDIRIRRR